jgi:UDP-galactopyranose mutase
MDLADTQIVIIGAGLSGAVLAERFASAGKRVLLIEKRASIGGNCYDYYNQVGILVSKYGPHIFHTNNHRVWAYAQRFADWLPYVHRVVAEVDGQLVPVPVNITTVNTLFNLELTSEAEMKNWLATQQEAVDPNLNSESAALARVGRKLYEKLFKHYTQKQWDRPPAELDASVLHRIPVRTTFDDRYFTDSFQGVPVGGYTAWIERICQQPNIKILLKTDYFEIKNDLPAYEALFYTGPIDQYFGYAYSSQGKLEYRSLRFEHETLEQEKYQDHPVINYPNQHNYTRIVEYKHLTGQLHPATTIVKEYPTWKGEPFYPVPTPKNRHLYSLYQTEAAKLSNIFFVGRLANYKYFNMDEAIENALQEFDRYQQAH